jgi:hypothetical protein
MKARKSRDMLAKPTTTDLNVSQHRSSALDKFSITEGCLYNGVDEPTAPTLTADYQDNLS